MSWGGNKLSENDWAPARALAVAKRLTPDMKDQEAKIFRESISQGKLASPKRKIAAILEDSETPQDFATPHAKRALYFNDGKSEC